MKTIKFVNEVQYTVLYNGSGNENPKLWNLDHYSEKFVKILKIK
jgi:hypothetical protein